MPDRTASLGEREGTWWLGGTTWHGHMYYVSQL